ncbi:TonB-dependent receptor [Pseudomonas sp. v388]|uniref:TonB-dependent receptor n=1 Tax=Pseudomonas sp. v388 TaxID=2479849 RepID=UPI000F7A9A4C|nr:TonB-dependent receptor [Pseudomonas sp. v388]RRV10215.1 TonB-dependent receptor [Pseudomonas sp. v388]
MPLPALRPPQSLVKNRLLPYALCVSGLSASGGLYGQVPEQKAPVELSAVEVSGQRSGRTTPDKRSVVSTDPTALPASVTTVDAEQISTINVGRDISNIFRRVPGVVANNIDQGDTGNGFRMRGFATQGTHGADTAVYVDGVPQNMPSSQGGAGHGPVFLEWLTPEMIGHLNVVKGPISALYGDQNRAGAVDIQTANARDVQSSIGLDISSFKGRRSNLVLSGEAQGVESLLVADVYRTDGYRNATRTERENLFWKLSTVHDDARYSVRLNHYRSESAGAGYLSLPAMEAGLSRRATQFNNPGFGDAKRTSLVFNRAPAEGEAGLYGTFYAEDFERTRAIATSATLHTVGKDDRTIFGGRIANNLVFGDTAALFVGADMRRDNGDALRQQYRDKAPTQNYINAFDMDLLTYGVFAQGQYRIIDSVKLLAGIRYDRFDYDIENIKYPAATTHYSRSVTTPKYGIVWSPLPSLDVFANVAQGYRSPAAEQISSGSSSAVPLGGSGGAVNGDIGATKVRSYDAGFTVRPTDDLSASATLFYTLNEDEIVQTAPQVYEQVGDTTRKGLDLDVSYRLNQQYSVYASYGRLLKAEVNNPPVNTGSKLSVPEHTYKVGAQYKDQLGAGQLTLNLDAYHLDGIAYYTGTPQTREREMPLYTRYDLKATYDYDRYQVSMYGIFQPHRYGSEVAYGTSTGLLVSPQPASQFGASVRYYF